MGFHMSAGRLVELGERERRSQPEAARALLLRDAMAVWSASSAGAESAGSRLSRISPRSRCRSASNAEWPACSAVASASSRMTSARRRIAGPSLGLGERDLDRPQREDIEFAQQLRPAPHFLKPATGCAAAPLAQPSRKAA